MKTVEQCKDEVAVKNGFPSWDDLLLRMIILLGEKPKSPSPKMIIKNKLSQYENEAMRLYASQWEWIAIEKEMPKKSDCYLCLTDDGWRMCCFLNVAGDWMLRPGGSFYGDIVGADPHLGKGKNRKITHWMPLPGEPNA